MSKVAVLADPHFGARSDAPAMQAQMSKFFREIFFPTLDDRGIKTILNAGDVFDHRKSTNTSTAQFAREHYRQPIRDREITEHVIVGNHDIFYKHSTLTNAVYEFYHLEPRLHIYTDPVEVIVEDCPILMLPWITDSNRDASLDLIRHSACQIVLSHLELVGFQMYRGMPNHEGMDPALFERFSLVMSGHYHHRSFVPPIQYLGAPYPMIWSDYDDPRGFHIFDTVTHELEFIQNPHSMFVRLVYDDTNQSKEWIKDVLRSIKAPESPYRDAFVKIVVKGKTQPYWLDMVVDLLGKIQTQDVVVIDDVIAVDGDETTEHDVTQDVNTRHIMREYVYGLETSCNKDELFTYMAGLLDESIAQTQTFREE